MVIAHNGIIDKVEGLIKGTDLTDTEGLVEHVLADLRDDWLDNPLLTAMMEEFIGWSKLVFLTNSPHLDANMYILNSEQGIWSNDIWFSNYSCFKSKAKQAQYAWDEWCDEEDKKVKNAFSYYHNGVYKEGSSADYGRDIRSDETNYDADHANRGNTAQDLRDANDEDHVDLFNSALTQLWACGICTGKEWCMCNDMCAYCYEFYHECDCSGVFLCMTDSFSGEWGARTQAIANDQSDPMPVPF